MSMEAFDGDCSEYLLKNIRKKEKIENFVNETNKIIYKVCNSKIVFFDVKPSNFVYRQAQDTARDAGIFKMIDFDLRYSLRIDEKDKEIIKHLLKVQMCIVGLNDLLDISVDIKKTFFDLYKESFEYILMNILTKEGVVGGIVREFLVKMPYSQFLRTIVHYSVGQIETSLINNITNFMNSIIEIYHIYTEPSSQSADGKSLFGRTAVMAPEKPSGELLLKGNKTELTKPAVDKGNWFGLDNIKWWFRQSSKDDDASSYNTSLKLELDSLDKKMFSNQKMIIIGK